MKRLTNRLLTAFAAALLFSALVTPALAAGVNVTPTARNLEQSGNIVPSFALIPYLSQMQSNAAATYGSWTLATVNNAAGTTITAGNMLGILETRTGAAAVTDTTDTAANIIAAIPGVTIGSQALWEIQNQNTGLLTLAGGTSVTMAGQIVVPINQTWLGQINVATGNIGSATVTQQGAGYSSGSPPTVTIAGGGCTGVTATATVPAGTNFVSGITITAAGSLCNSPSLVTCVIGAPVLSGTLTVPATCTANVVPTNVTITGYTTVPAAALPNTQFRSISAGNGTFLAGDISGGTYTVLASSGATAMTTRTATLMFGDVPNAQAGLSYYLRIYNTNAGTLTLTGGTGVTITGTATIATAIWRDYVVTLNSATTLTMQNVGSGTAN